MTVLETGDDVTHVALSGPLDLAGVAAVERRFVIQTAVRRHPTIVDLSKVELLASIGIGMLVEAARGLRLHGRKLVLLAPTPPVERVLAATHVIEILPIARTLDEARALLAV